jgi:hypothetical protein
MRKIDPIRALLRSLTEKERKEMTETRDRSSSRKGDWERDEMMDSFFTSKPEESTWENEFNKAESKSKILNEESTYVARIDAIRRHLVPDLEKTFERVLDELNETKTAQWEMNVSTSFDTENQWNVASSAFLQESWDSDEIFDDNYEPVYTGKDITIVVNKDGYFGWHYGWGYDPDKLQWFDTKNWDEIVDKLIKLIK